MRVLPIVLVVLVFLLVGCGGNFGVTRDKGSVIGSWQLMGMLKTPFDIDKITETDLMGGTMVFKTDGTFEGEVNYPRSPEHNIAILGTYQVENGILTINNHTNNSTTKSKIKFEKNFMILTPLNPEGLIAYYRRIE